MSADPIFVLPGDRLDPALIPSHPKKPLRLGPGLRHVPPNRVLPTLAGQFVTDWSKNAIRVETSHGRYTPRPGELIIGTVQKSAPETYYISLSDHSPPSLLPHLSFESATKKTRPILPPSSLVYARVATATKHLDAQLECVNASTGKADGLGPLVGGMLFAISPGMARRLLMPKSAQDAKLVVLEELAAQGLHFETATGRNGRFWVDSESAKTVVAVGRAVQETDEGRLDVERQKKVVRRLIRELS